MKTILLLFCLALTLQSCNKKQLCTEAEISVPGIIKSITGSDTLLAGQTIILIVEVINSDSICTKRADGHVLEVRNNYAQIGATLVCGTLTGENCDCIHSATVKTLVYFTPKDKGRYLFGTKKTDTSVGNTTTPPSIYEVIVL
ncbi:MAG: hypothetical protein WC716_13680 [Chitinophagaceae bacterium]|jgi:hypothetical protein